MRLDHLLSKEHLAPLGVPRARSGRMFSGGQLVGGTFDGAPVGEFWPQYAASVVGTGWGCRVGACTLLGPEGPDAHRLVCVTDLWAHPGCRLWPAGRGGYRPYFENYTVDASILKR